MAIMIKGEDARISRGVEIRSTAGKVEGALSEAIGVAVVLLAQRDGKRARECMHL
jgi:hypothetical protein